jgi:hypothetical protein
MPKLREPVVLLDELVARHTLREILQIDPARKQQVDHCRRKRTARVSFFRCGGHHQNDACNKGKESDNT